MKAKRQRRILEIITENDISTQEDIVSILLSEGYDITQATVSRDIRELGITKICVDGKKLKYVSDQNILYSVNPKMVTTLKTGYSSMTLAGNILVVKTSTGMAMAVAAVIDAMKIDEIAGCIAGDDTIFCAVKSINDGESVMNKIKETLSK